MAILEVKKADTDRFGSQKLELSRKAKVAATYDLTLTFSCWTTLHKQIRKSDLSCQNEHFPSAS